MFQWKEHYMPAFLEAYRNYECLWNTNLVEYHKVHIRENAYRAILTDLNFPGLEVSNVKAKIKTIRTRYSSELTQIKKSEKSGAGIGDIYVPRLSWFKEADAFLRAVCTPRESSTNMKASLIKKENPADELEIIHEVESEDENMDNIQPVAKKPQKRTPISLTKITKKRTYNNMESIQGAIEKLSKISEDNNNILQHTEPLNEFDHFCNSLAVQLKKMPIKRALKCQQKLQAIITQERLSAIRDEENATSTPSPEVEYLDDAMSPSPNFYYESIESYNNNNSC